MVILGSKEDVFPLWMEKMNSLRKDKTLYDVCIKVGDDQITAHKSVLASASEYFNSYFVGPLKTEDAIAEVDLSTIALDFESADAVVDFLYRGVIDIHDENLEAILKLATFLLIYPLKELCIKYMEQSCDLNSYMWYYILSVDNMVDDTEYAIMVNTVKPRFHDWFINENSTMALSPYHLQKLIEDYDIFEHCSQIDRLTFLVDWVLNGKTEEHEELVCKIFDGEVAPISYDESLNDGEPQSDDNEQSDEDPHCRTDPQNDNGESQSNGEQQKDYEQQNYGSHSVSVLQNENEELNKLKQIIEVTHNDNELQKRNEEQESIEPESEEVHKINSVDEQRLRRLGFNIPKAVEKIKKKLESTKCSKEFVGKCTEVIDYLISQFIDDFQQNKADGACAEPETLKQQNQGSDVEHVLIAIAPKQLYKDFHHEIHQSRDEILDSPDDAIFDICIYAPHKLTWYYFGEGKNTTEFRQMGNGDITSIICMLDNLCCVSESESKVYMYMYSLKNCHTNSRWSYTSSDNLDTDDPRSFGFDNSTYDVKLFSADGKNLFLVLKKTNRVNTVSKVKFKCFWSVNPNNWDFVFETPYIHKSEDSMIDFGSFDVNVSPGNKELYIAAKGRRLHVFVADLQKRGFELKHHIVEAFETQSGVDDLWKPQTDIHIMLDEKQLSVVEETTDNEERLHYRIRKIDNSGKMTIELTQYYVFDTRFPTSRDVQDFGETPIKFLQRVSDGRSLWCYLSDGKFETSLAEIRPNENGFMGFIEHIPPPFSAVTMMAAGKVKREHFADLKPMTDFLQKKK